METKTFEELKQMAIQIRDEKTNKQNTATRIGTQMLEHLNKLEQDFLDKDTTEGKFSELENKIDDIEINPIIINGDVTNNPDNEDLESIINPQTQQGQLKFANRAYLPSNFSGKGYKILRKNIGTVIDFDAIADVIHVMQDINPSSDVMSETYEGDVEFVVINSVDKEVYGAVKVKTGTWTFKFVWYKNWTGTTNYDRTKFSTEDGKPLENGIYCIGNVKPYKIYKSGSFVTYDISNGAPTKQGNILRQEDVSQPNMVYEIRYDYINNFETITIGKDCVLKFVGGSLANVKLSFDNTIIENNSNYCILKDVDINEYGYLVNEFIYDCWHNDIFGYDVIRSIKGLILTKDYVISDLQHFIKGSANTADNKYKRSLTIDGQNHTITINSQNFTVNKTFLAIETIICQNLRIIETNQDQEQHIETIFNSGIARFYNVYFEGYCRLCSNWSFNWDGQDYTELTVHNCSMYTTEFLFENRFDIVDIRHSYLSGRPEIRWGYMHDIISIGAQKQNGIGAHANIINSTIVGAWELTNGIHVENVDTGQYETISILNSNLKYFRVGRQGSTTKGMNIQLLIDNCKLTFGVSVQSMFNGVNTLTFQSCNFVCVFETLYGGSPIDVMSVEKVIFKQCNIDFRTDSVGGIGTAPFIRCSKNNPFEEHTVIIDNVQIHSDRSYPFIGVVDAENTTEVIDWSINHLIFKGCNIVKPSHIESDPNSSVYIYLAKGIVSNPGFLINDFVLLPFINQLICYNGSISSIKKLTNDNRIAYLKHIKCYSLQVLFIFLSNLTKGYGISELHGALNITLRDITYNGYSLYNYIEI